MIKSKKGETLVEVVMGLAILTTVLVGAYILTNQATRITQEANERTEVSNFMRQQAEILESAEADYRAGGDSTQWDDILALVSPLAADYNASCEAVPQGSGNLKVAIPSAVSNPFVLAPNLSNNNPSVPATLADDFAVEPAFNSLDVQVGNHFGDGNYTIWIEGFRGQDDSGSNLGTYIDFYITSCWEKIGGGQIEKSGLVVRFAE